MRLVIMRPSGCRQEHPGGPFGEAHRRSAHLHRRALPLPRTAADRSGQGGAALHGCGEYVPDAVANAMVHERLRLNDAKDAFVLDAFPRTLGRARLGSQHGVEARAAPARPAPPVARALSCKGRSDDTEPVMLHRQDVYTAQTGPVFASFARRGIVVRVDGSGDPDSVAGRIDTIVKYDATSPD